LNSSSPTLTIKLVEKSSTVGLRIEVRGGWDQNLSVHTGALTNIKGNNLLSYRDTTRGNKLDICPL